MRKFWWIVVVVVLVIAGMIPYEQHDHLLIKKRYENVYSLLLKPEQWQKWHPQVKAAWRRDAVALEIEKQKLGFKINAAKLHIDVRINGFGFDVDQELGSFSSVYSFTVLPATNTRYTDVQLITLSSFFKKLSGWLWHTSPLLDLRSLKQFIEDDKAYYGYNISIQNAVDTSIAVEQKTVSVKERNTTVATIRQNLQRFVEKNGLKITQPIMADIRTLYQDSIRVMIGFSVNKAFKPEGNINIMRIPKQAKMLTVVYRGKYGNRQSAYTVLKNYMRDYELLAPEVPYEKYLNNRIPLSDSDKVVMQIIAPLQ